MKAGDLLNSKYKKKAEIEKLSKKFREAKHFEHISIDDLFSSKALKFLSNALENQEYYVEEHDLYEFYRTVDFKNIGNDELVEFRKLLMSEEFVSLIEQITGVKIKRKKIDLHSLMLVDTNYLLCHDDQVQDRSIAFIINLSDFKPSWGGALEMFESEEGRATKVFKSITPKYGRFNMFKVGPKSFHQISEVVGDHERVSISGWFYDE